MLALIWRSTSRSTDAILLLTAPRSFFPQHSNLSWPVSRELGFERKALTISQSTSDRTWRPYDIRESSRSAAGSRSCAHRCDHSSFCRPRWPSAWPGTPTVISGVAGGAAEAQSVLKDLIEAGKLRTVIDRRYSLDQISDAHRYADAEHKRGHVVILVERTVPRR
jgi:hypothetical protein